MTEPAWIRRFTAPVLNFPRWAKRRPQRLVLGSNHEGAFQLYAWDRDGGAGLRRLTASPVGVTAGHLSPDGRLAYWFDDPTGDETGRWVSVPFEGGETVGLERTAEPAWPAGFEVTDAGLFVGRSTRQGYRVIRLLGGEVTELEADPRSLHLAAASPDGGLVAIEHAVGDDYLHPGIRVRAGAGGEMVADLVDPGLALAAVAFAPGRDDGRLLIQHERGGRAEPAILDAASGEWRDLETGLSGEVVPLDWWPDGAAVLLKQSFQGADRLHRLEVATGGVDPLDHPHGTVSHAAVRPDGEVWLRHSSGATPWTLMNLDRRRLIEAGEPAPAGAPYRSWFFANPAGERVHGFVAAPSRPGPHPVLMWVHGGPHYQYGDWFMPEVQAWIDHGVSVAMVNYRGSTGYGQAWRDLLIGNPGFPEVEDTVAGLDDLVAGGAVDPTRVILGGRSWGGYVTLLGAGLHPDRWAVALATVPVADYPAAFEDEGPDLQAMDRQLFGGTPAERPELYRERSPLTYADRVRAPLLIIAGDNDIRCPIRQILNYAEALGRRGQPPYLYRYTAGHGSLLTDERIHQMRLQLDFANTHLPGGLPVGVE